MEICEAAGVLYDKLLAALTSVAESGVGDIRSHEQAVACVYDHLQELKELIKKYKFKDTREEICFFKEIKPKFTSQLIYHMAVYNIETEKPVGLEQAMKEYYQKELEKLQYFFHENLDFHKYYRSGAVHLDEKYFFRGNFDIHLVKGAFLPDLDPNFSTLCDYKVARIMANEMLIVFLNNALADLELNRNGIAKHSVVSKSHLAWTASKTDFIELLYGLHCIGAFNNGSVELNKVMNTFAVSFGIDFGNYSRYFQQMRIRKKNRTNFIDKIRDKLINYMDELDDQLDERL